MADIVERLRKTRDPLAREAATFINHLRKALKQAGDEVPTYANGSNDRLQDRIDKLLMPKEPPAG